jgi:hypothetical protein
MTDTAASPRYCGRPTKAGAPCKAQLYGMMYRACTIHQTAEDIAYTEGWQAANEVNRRRDRDDRDFWIAEGRRQAEREAAAKAGARVIPPGGDRRDGLVTVVYHVVGEVTADMADRGNAYRAAEPVSVGDIVEVPGPYWRPRGTTQKATVVAHGSEYDGEVLDMIRVLARPQTAAEAKALAVAEDRKERTI